MNSPATRIAISLAIVIFVFVFLKSEGEKGLYPNKPELTIVRPITGETYADKPIFVKVKVENFKLLPPREFWAPTSNQKEGHIHIILDNFPIFATAETQCMIGKMIGDKYLTEGKHHISVELVKINHESLFPQVIRYVDFQTSNHAAAHGSLGN